MSRLIDADALLVSMWKMLYALEDKAEKDFVGTDNHDEWFYTFRPWLQRGHEIGVIAVNDAPTVDAVPVVHGHWIASDPRTTDAFWVCSCCGFPSEAHGAFKLYHYCPQCGAKMDALAKDINVRCKSDEVTES